MANSNQELIEEISRNIEHESAAEDVAENVQKYLSFMLDGEIYAFNIMGIKEIIEYGNINRIPMVPGYIRGVTNLRGSVVPVIDLSIRLGKAQLPVSKKTCIVIVEVKADDEIADVGVVIDSIYEVSGFRERDIEPAPGFGAGIPAEFIEGMGKRGENFVILLNAARVLSIEELSALIGDMAPARPQVRRGKSMSEQSESASESSVDK